MRTSPEQKRITFVWNTSKSPGGKRAFRERVALANVPSFRFSFPGEHANVPSFRFSFRGNIRMYPRFRFSFQGEHPPKPPFCQPPKCTTFVWNMHWCMPVKRDRELPVQGMVWRIQKWDENEIGTRYQSAILRPSRDKKGWHASLHYWSARCPETPQNEMHFWKTTLAWIYGNKFLDPEVLQSEFVVMFFFFFCLANFRKIVGEFLSEFWWLFFRPCFSRISGPQKKSRPKLSAFFPISLFFLKFSDSVKRHLSRRHLSVLNLNFNFIFNGGCTRENKLHSH